jgi:glycosyltransferase involved in cell wall biosynthesis
MPNVSVIIPTYNRAYILPEAVESVLSQTYADFELIIVDDGSTDETASMVGGFGDQRIRFFQHDRNRGVAAARNTGLAEAQGVFVAFFDSDDIWMAEKLSVQIAFLEGHPEVGGVFSDLVWVSGDRKVQSMLRTYPGFSRLLRERQREIDVVFSQHAIYACLLEEMPVKLQATTLRRDRVWEAGPFEESWRSGEDWEFLLRFSRANALGYVDCALTVLRTMPDSTLGRHKKLDAQFLMELFIAEKQKLRREPDAIAAVRRGIAQHTRELGWQYLNEGDRRSALVAYWRGFAHSRDFKLFARCAGSMLPSGTRGFLKRLRNGHAA